MLIGNQNKYINVLVLERKWAKLVNILVEKSVNNWKLLLRRREIYY